MTSPDDHRPAAASCPDQSGPRRAITMLPNAISLLRLAGAPVLVAIAAVTDSRGWFAAVFGVMLLSDGLDGFLARRLHAVSDLGRRLDSHADYATILATLTGMALLWPAVMRHEWLWFAVGLSACFASTLYSLVRWHRIPGFHTRLAKTLAVLVPLTLVVMLAGWSEVPFHLAVGVQVLSGIEELTIARLLPGYAGEMTSAWHAWRRRRRAEDQT